ncbi:rhomboid family intramembrane serine protease [Psychrobacter sp. 2Y5]|uniref:rhomboid family intramembrane serine protease n=1 Tax=unclassified Psychrobacter TaxID=196806 RepID=UPI003F45ED75
MTIKQLFSTAPVTTILLISFIGLFVIQLLTGVDANNPSTEALLNWGANALPYTMGEDPWRLISSGFLHIGLMHLLFNSFAMYFFGQIAEPMFGSSKFLALFLLAVIGGNVLNNHVTWQAIIDGSGQPGLSAGASGGIMGIGAALLVAAFFKMSVNGMMINLKSLVIIMGINLVYGFAVPGIDNAGHIGGAITGLLIALPIAFAYRQRELAQQAAMAGAQQAYQNAVQDSYSSNHQHSYQTSLQNTHRDNPPLTNIFADNDSQIPVNLNNNADSANLERSGDYINQYPTYIDPKRFVPEPIKISLIWQLLPWIVMLIITVSFIWWWQDIHNQILQILAATE